MILKLNLLLVVLMWTSSAQNINYYEISADLPFYYRSCTNGTKYIFTKDHYLDLTQQPTSRWVPSDDTSKVPVICSQSLGGSSACFLSEITSKYSSLSNIREDLKVQALTRYINNHCTST